MALFKNRVEGGRLLAQRLSFFDPKSTIILGLARGGVILAYEIGCLLQIPFSALIIQKIGHPFAPEYAIGAIHPDGTSLLNHQECSTIEQEWLSKELEKKQTIAKQRYTEYFKNHPFPCVKGKTVILVDDGIATGLSMELAINWSYHAQAKAVYIATPIASEEALKKLTCKSEGSFCLHIASDLESVGAFYEEFDQVEDRIIKELLSKSELK